jgi:hypothetical protein
VVTWRMIRHVVLLEVPLAAVLLCTGCIGAGSPAQLDPEAKLELRSKNGGYHGGGSELKVDRAGRYTYHHASLDSRGGGRIGDCEGELPAITTAWIDRVAALPLVPYDDEAYREMIGATDSRTGGFYIVYHPSTGVPQMPADESVHDSVRDEAQGWLSTYREQRTPSESCRLTQDDHEGSK